MAASVSMNVQLYQTVDAGPTSTLNIAVTPAAPAMNRQNNTYLTGQSGNYTYTTTNTTNGLYVVNPNIGTTVNVYVTSVVGTNLVAVLPAANASGQASLPLYLPGPGNKSFIFTVASGTYDLSILEF